MGIPVERLPDETLLAGLATADPEIALAFVRRFQSKVFAAALAIVGERRLAEDVAQHAFERAWRHAQMYDARRGSVGTWLGTITRNLAIDAARARKAVPVDPDDLGALLSAMTQTPEDVAEAAETSAELSHLLAALPPEQARAIVMAAVYGMSARQIAEYEGIPLGTAKSRIRAALEKLRASLAERRAGHG